jgi:hypothetical protein
MLRQADDILERSQKPLSLANKYVKFHSWILLGYALAGRGFAYLGLPPLYIGEISVFLGLLTFSVNKSFPKVLKLPQIWLLILFMSWCCINTVPYFSLYGIDCIRDAALWYYCFYAFIFSTLLIGNPERFLFMVTQYRRFSKIFLTVIPIVWTLSSHVSLPYVPGTDVTIIFLKPADTMAHFAGISAFFYGSSLLAINDLTFSFLYLVNLIAVGVNSNRSGTLGFLNAFLVITIAKFNSSKLWKMLFFLISIIIAVLIICPQIYEPVAGKVVSIFTDNGVREGSKEFRLDWWNYIINYTIYGEYFWTGKGFGINLSLADHHDPTGDGKVRSPHNGHLTVLARSGVPGLVLWILVQLSWAIAILFKYFQCRARGQTRWSGIFLTLFVYWVASMTVTAFEVVIEGPTGGIWLWTMYGVGLAAMKLHKHFPQLLDQDPVTTTIIKKGWWRKWWQWVVS